MNTLLVKRLRVSRVSKLPPKVATSDPSDPLRFNKKIDIVFRVTEFDFRFVCYIKLLTHLSHNVGKTVISELAVKIKHLCCMIMRS